MSQAQENPADYRALFNGALIRVEDYCCRYARGGPGREECFDENQIVLLRQGAFCQHLSRRRRLLAAANQAFFFSAGVNYRVSHPGDCGDRARC